MFSLYTRLLIKYPITTKMVTSGVVFSIGDIITQKVVDKKQEIDLKRNLNLFLCGSTYIAPLYHVWYGSVLPAFENMILKESAKKSARVFTFMSADQVLFTPFYLFGFFIYDGIMNSFTIEGFQKGYANSKQKLWETLYINWMIWPFAMTINFAFVPVLYQVSFLLACQFFWNIMLSYIAYDQTPDHTILPHHHDKTEQVLRQHNKQQQIKEAALPLKEQISQKVV